MRFRWGRVQLNWAATLRLRLEQRLTRGFGWVAAKANGTLGVSFSGHGHTSGVRAEARFKSETGSRSGRINETPQLHGAKPNLLRAEPLDEDHGSTTAWTRPGGWRLGWCRARGRRWRPGREHLTADGQQGGSPPVSKEAEKADTNETLGQDVP